MVDKAWIRSNSIFLVVIAAGIFLRLVWVEDMEWKFDEQWMFNHSREIAKTGDWPLLGMDSSKNIKNPVFSLWVFAAFSHVADDPLSLTRMVQFVNITSILCFLVFIFAKVEKNQRDIWLWGLALASVSPLAVLFSRKLWMQDILPIFSFTVILGNACRNTAWGGWLWGLAGALIGQVHMSGFFYASGLFAFTVAYDFRNENKTRWGYWALGSLMGSVALVPWLYYLWGISYSGSGSFEFKRILELRFYTNWFADAHGIHLKYSMGREAFSDFLKSPYFKDTPTYAIGLLHLFMVGVGLFSIKKTIGDIKLGLERVRTGGFLSNLNLADFYILSALIGMGVSLTLTGSRISPSYLIVVFPFSYIWLARILYPGKKAMIGALLSQLIITAAFLGYVHEHHGIAGGDYGESFKAQMERSR